MMRRAAMMAAGLAVASSMAWTGGVASASHQGPKSTGPVTFTGTFMADLTGTITFSPPLTNTVAHETIVTTTATSTQFSGNLSESGAVIRGASMTGNGGGGIPGSSCLNIFAGQTNYGIPLGELQVVYKTKSGTRAAAPTAMFFAPLALTGSSVLSAKQKSFIGAGGYFRAQHDGKEAISDTAFDLRPEPEHVAGRFRGRRSESADVHGCRGEVTALHRLSACAFRRCSVCPCRSRHGQTRFLNKAQELRFVMIT